MNDNTQTSRPGQSASSNSQSASRMEGGVGFLLNHVGNLFSKDLNRRLSAAGIAVTSEQWLVLNRIGANKAVSLSKLSRVVRKDEASVSRIVQGLVKKEWVRRKPIPGDRRRVALELSSAGRKVLESAAEYPRKTYRCAVKGIPKDQVDAMMDVVRKIIQNLEEESYDT